MPIPQPYQGENEDAFMSRCISFLENEGREHNEAVAICSNAWNNKNLNSMLIDESKFRNKKDLFKFLVQNKEMLIAQKTAVPKYADGFIYHPDIVTKALTATKANEPVKLENLNELNVLAVINTTNWFDSHKDVHVPGLWDKSLAENKMLMHVQEHKLQEFSKIIASGSDLKAFTKKYSWSELGFNYPGETEALVFDSIVKRKRNPFMFEQYGEGYVNNHSVGMRYVKLVLAVNDEDYGAEYEMWQKYFEIIANKEAAEDSGYFWAVKEAKAIEGSAVPLGSNIATPTIDNNKSEPYSYTPNEPVQSTHRKINYAYLRDNFEL